MNNNESDHSAFPFTSQYLDSAIPVEVRLLHALNEQLRRKEDRPPDAHENETDVVLKGTTNNSNAVISHNTNDNALYNISYSGSNAEFQLSRPTEEQWDSEWEELFAIDEQDETTASITNREDETLNSRDDDIESAIRKLGDRITSEDINSSFNTAEVDIRVDSSGPVDVSEAQTSRVPIKLSSTGSKFLGHDKTDSTNDHRPNAAGWTSSPYWR